VELEEPYRFTGALGAGDVFSFESRHSDEILLSQLPSDSAVAEKEDMTTLRFSVGTSIGPIRVRVASELIIAASAGEMQSIVRCAFEILENPFGCGEMAGESVEIVFAKCSDCKCVTPGDPP